MPKKLIIKFTHIQSHTHISVANMCIVKRSISITPHELCTRFTYAWVCGTCLCQTCTEMQSTYTMKIAWHGNSFSITGWPLVRDIYHSSLFFSAYRWFYAIFHLMPPFKMADGNPLMVTAFWVLYHIMAGRAFVVGKEVILHGNCNILTLR